MDVPPYASRGTEGAYKKIRAIQMARKQRCRGRFFDPEPSEGLEEGYQAPSLLDFTHESKYTSFSRLVPLPFHHHVK